MRKAILSWSGGKDAMHALHDTLESGEYVITALLSTYDVDSNRVFMHGVGMDLIRRQADALGLRLIEVGLGRGQTNREYEDAMGEVLQDEKASGAASVIFGDIFLEDIRQYRTERLAHAGMDAVFPLWKRDTKELAHRFIGLGYKAIVTCVDGNELDEEYVGCEFDEAFLKRLPPSVDPCGEYGEFHTFVYDGPGFREKIEAAAGEKTKRDNRFWFCELGTP
jgi:uncharacterized protein (TIGR00290 family)